MAFLNLDVFLTTLSAMTKILFICVVGAVAARFPRGSPLLPVTLLRQLGRLQNMLMLPCLLFTSMASTVSYDMLLRFLPLLLGGLVIIPLSNAVSKLLKWIFCLPSDTFTPMLIMATTFPNCVSLPLLLLETLCEQHLVHSEFEDEAECFVVGSEMCFVYSIGWHFLFWSWCYPVLQSSAQCTASKIAHSDEAEKNAKETSDKPPNLLGADTLTPLDMSPLTKENALSLMEAPKSLTTTHLRRLSLQSKQTNGEEDATSPEVPGRRYSYVSQVDSDEEANEKHADLSQDVIPKLLKVIPQISGKFHSVGKNLALGCKRLLFQPNIISTLAGICVGLSPLQERMYKDESSPLQPFAGAISAIGKPCVILSILIMAGSLAQIDISNFAKKKNDPGLFRETFQSSEEPKDLKRYPARSIFTWKHVVFFLFSRLLIFPALGAFLLISTIRYAVPMIASSKLLQLVLVIQTAVPSAQMMIVCLSELNHQAAATTMSMLYVIQYLFSIFTLTIILSCVMSYIYV